MSTGTNNLITRLSSLLWTKATMLPLNYSAFRTPHSAFDRLRTPKFWHSLVRRPSSVVLLVFLLASCGGGSSTPANVGGGYTLVVSGGTLNDGSGYNGLVVLATLRNSDGWGPTMPWTITITGPGIDSLAPISLDYQDGQPGSYMSWEWAGFEPTGGTYHATATNAGGSVSIHYDFTINSNSTLLRPAPNANTSANTINFTWPAVFGAKSYSYEVCSPTLNCLSGMTTSLSAVADFGIFGSLETGDHLIRVRAYSSDHVALYASRSSSPSLAAQENASEYTFSYPVNGDPNAGSYTLHAALGINDYGLRGPAPAYTPTYGLSIWTSIMNNNTVPSGNWNISIEDPNGFVTNFIYPANAEHYAYWYYGIEPVAGTYTITATYGSVTNTKTASFTLSDTNPLLLPLVVTELASDISVTKQTNNNDRTISWTSVSGAGSYYVNLWAETLNAVTKQYEYDEIFGQWVAGTATTLVVPAATFQVGIQYDVFVTAHKVDMSSATPPGTAPLRADMSENHSPYSFIAQ